MSSAFNGRASDRPAGVSANGRPGVGGYSSWDEDRESTRYMSARTQMSIPYARDVVHRVVSERFRALAPSYGVDVAVVARWALSSVRLRARRDRHLAGLLVAGIPLFFLLLYLWQWASLLSIVAALAAAWVVVAHEYMQRINIVCEQCFAGGLTHRRRLSQRASGNAAGWPWYRSGGRGTSSCLRETWHSLAVGTGSARSTLLST